MCVQGKNGPLLRLTFLHHDSWYTKKDPLVNQIKYCKKLYLTRNYLIENKKDYNVLKALL